MGRAFGLTALVAIRIGRPIGYSDHLRVPHLLTKRAPPGSRGVTAGLDGSVHIRITDGYRQRRVDLSGFADHAREFGVLVFAACLCRDRSASLRVKRTRGC